MEKVAISETNYEQKIFCTGMICLDATRHRLLSPWQQVVWHDRSGLAA